VSGGFFFFFGFFRLVILLGPKEFKLELNQNHEIDAKDRN